MFRQWYSPHPSLEAHGRIPKYSLHPRRIFPEFIGKSYNCYCIGVQNDLIENNYLKWINVISWLRIFFKWTGTHSPFIVSPFIFSIFGKLLLLKKKYTFAIFACKILEYAIFQNTKQFISNHFISINEIKLVWCKGLLSVRNLRKILLRRANNRRICIKKTDHSDWQCI